MNSGSFGDNMASFMGGLTGEIIKRKDEERQRKMQDEDAQLKVGLNLFSEMVSQPEKYSNDQLHTFAAMLDKNHKLKDVLGGDIHTEVGKLVSEREKTYRHYKLDESMTNMAPGSLGSYSPEYLQKLAIESDRRKYESIGRNNELNFKGLMAAQEQQSAHTKQISDMEVARIKAMYDSQDAIRKQQSDAFQRDQDRKSREYGYQLRAQPRQPAPADIERRVDATFNAMLRNDPSMISKTIDEKLSMRKDIKDMLSGIPRTPPPKKELFDRSILDALGIPGNTTTTTTPSVTTTTNPYRW